MKFTFEQMIVIIIHLGKNNFYLNPKISKSSYIIYEGSYIIDLVKNNQGIFIAQKTTLNIVRQQKNILFIRTKVTSVKAIEETAKVSKIFFVSERWLGGILTNWHTISNSLIRLFFFEQEQRKVSWVFLQKKENSVLNKCLNRLKKDFNGLTEIQSIPKVVIIVDPIIEFNAIQEC